MLCLSAMLGACGDDDGGVSERADQVLDGAQQRAGKAVDALGETGESVGARVLAEAVRAALVAEDLGAGESLRDVAVLREAVGDLPGEPVVGGIEDGDGDGLDDDGKVEVALNDERACLSVAEGGDIDVEGGAC